MKFRLLIAMLLMSQFSHASPEIRPSSGSIDLHTHLFMDQGIPWFQGTFNDDVLASHSWKTRFRSQINPATLERSGIQIVVAALYAFPVNGESRRNAIRSQVVTAHRFIQTHSDWVLAESATQARQAIERGKRVMILSLEGADGILETEKDFKEFIDQDGIRIVTPLHLTDDHLGGAAFMKGYHVLSNPFRYLNPSQHGRDVDGILVNDNGLAPDGLVLIEKLMARNVWIDLSHASDASQSDMVTLMRAQGLPLLYTHTILRKYHGAERGISAQQLADVKNSRGIVGVLPSEEDLANTGGRDGLAAFIQQYAEFSEALGDPSRVLIGSDFNGGVPHLPPSCGTGTSLDKIGLQNIGQEGDLWSALKLLNPKASIDFSKMTETFLTTWARVNP